MNAYLAEFLGAVILVLSGGGVCANVNLKCSVGQESDWIVIVAGWGSAIIMGVYAVGQFSGAHLNPAATIALAVEGSFSWAEVPGYTVCQMLGGIVGVTLVWLMCLPYWRVTTEQDARLGVFSAAPAIKNYSVNFLSGIVDTAILSLGILFIGVNKIADGLNPLIVGSLITAIGLSLGGPTGCAINPARDLGPGTAYAILPIAGKSGSDWWYAIVPVLGPIAGGTIGAVIYQVFHKNEFTFMSSVSIVVSIVILLIGLALDKLNKHKDIESIY